ncbi:MAG: hypothetical protein ACW99G_16830 [Candidatus Thorarchaeota archaeon]|jgi:hypothetical protein
MGEGEETTIGMARLIQQERTGHILSNCGLMSLSGTLILFPFIMMTIGFSTTILAIILESVLLIGGFVLYNSAGTTLREKEIDPAITRERLGEGVMRLISQEWWGRGLVVAGSVTTLFSLQMSYMSGPSGVEGLLSSPFMGWVVFGMFLFLIGSLQYFDAKKKLHIDRISQSIS